MTTRELFESRFPVPDGWVCFGGVYVAMSKDIAGPYDAIEYNAQWVGFQAGYAAAKEGK